MIGKRFTSIDWAKFLSFNHFWYDNDIKYARCIMYMPLFLIFLLATLKSISNFFELCLGNNNEHCFIMGKKRENIAKYNDLARFVRN